MGHLVSHSFSLLVGALSSNITSVTSALGVTVQLGYNPKTHSSDYISKEVNVGLGVRVRHGARLSRLVRLTVCVLQMIG